MNYKDKARLKAHLLNDLTIVEQAIPLLIENNDKPLNVPVNEYAKIYNAVVRLGNTACEYAFKNLNTAMYQGNYKTLAGGSLRKPELINIRFAKKDAAALSDIDERANEFMRIAKKADCYGKYYQITTSERIYMAHAMSELLIAYDFITW